MAFECNVLNERSKSLAHVGKWEGEQDLGEEKSLGVLALEKDRKMLLAHFAGRQSSLLYHPSSGDKVSEQPGRAMEHPTWGA